MLGNGVDDYCTKKPDMEVLPHPILQMRMVVLLPRNLP